MSMDFFTLVGGVAGGAVAFVVIFFVAVAALAGVLKLVVGLGSRVPVWLGVKRARTTQPLPLEALNSSPQIL